MAQKVTIILTDDLDGSPADETVSFALDGRDYEIDLSAKHAGDLRDVLAVYTAHARRAGGRKRGRAGNGPSPADIRTWARENGFTVPDRGRVSSEVREAYVAAH
ncbi:MAG TPA: Lsr2 family protein [Marmoricola sp.]|jgi:hypothetical protein|nr:Lsr2 family protein [Marmoricola sp.]